MVCEASIRRILIWSLVSLGCNCKRRAQAPLIKGTDIEVPLLIWYPLPGFKLMMLVPGATSSGFVM